MALGRTGPCCGSIEPFLHPCCFSQRLCKRGCGAHMILKILQGFSRVPCLRSAELKPQQKRRGCQLAVVGAGDVCRRLQLGILTDSSLSLGRGFAILYRLPQGSLGIQLQHMEPSVIQRRFCGMSCPQEYRQSPPLRSWVLGASCEATSRGEPKLELTAIPKSSV